MPQYLSRRPLVCAGCLGLLVLAGCSGGASPVHVTGKLVLPSGLKVLENDAVQVAFVPEDGGGKTGNAKVNNSDLTFESKNTVPGKYKVTLKITPSPGTKDSELRKQTFQQINTTFDVNRTKMTADVSADAEQTLTLDFVKGTAGK
jgi:hypothetical protein